MTGTIKKCVDHWDDIINRVSGHAGELISTEMYSGKECPLCQKYYEGGEDDVPCWACPLAYQSWAADNYKGAYAFGGTCAREWNIFAAYATKVSDESAVISEGSLQAAIDMRDVLKNIDEERRFKKWEDFVKKVLND